MNASINFELREYKTNANGEAPLYLRITYDRKPAWMSLGISLSPKYWNTGTQKISKSYGASRAKKLNSYLFKIKSKAQDAIIELEEIGKLNSKNVIAIVKGEDKKDFFSYAKSYIKKQKEKGSIRISKNAQVIVNQIEHYIKKDSLRLQDIDHDFIEGFSNHLSNKKKPNKSNTIRKKFQRLSHLLKTAKKDGYLRENPFDDYDLPSYQRPKKDALTYEQIKSIEALELKPNSGKWHTRNYFLFSFYNAGIRFGDLCKLKRENIVDGRLKYLMSKTAGNSEPKWKNINLLPQAIEILERYNYQDKKPKEYLFPILDTSKNVDDPMIFDREKQSKTALANKYLKKIAKKAEIDQNLSTHIARHSFANYALKSGMNLYAISKALAHSDLETTQSYLKSFDEELLDKEMNNLFG